MVNFIVFLMGRSWMGLDYANLLANIQLLLIRRFPLVQLHLVVQEMTTSVENVSRVHLWYPDLDKISYDSICSQCPFLSICIFIPLTREMITMQSFKQNFTSLTLFVVFFPFYPFIYYYLILCFVISPLLVFVPYLKYFSLDYLHHNFIFKNTFFSLKL